MKHWDKLPLATQEKELLREFMLSILPATTTKRSGRNNELCTLANALDRWFMRYYRFHVGLTALAELLEELKYTLRPMGETYDPEHKKFRSVPPNGEYRGEAPYLKYKAARIYVNVDPMRVAYIRKLTYHEQSNTNVEKLIGRGPLEDELRTFRVKHLL